MIEMMYPVVPLDAVIRGTVVATDMIEWAVLVVDTEVMVLQAMVDHRHRQATHLPTSLTYIQAVDMQTNAIPVS